jgi:hypothetical protein
MQAVLPMQAVSSMQAAPVQTPASAGQTKPSEDFNIPALDTGYQRYETMPIALGVGESDDWAQWVGGPLDQDYDVIDIKGEQSVGGHHALVYATVDEQPAGFTRKWQDEDQLTTRLMGGLGGEAGAKVNLPPGVVFRVKKGSYIVVQTHYLNATDHAITGRTVLDIKMGPVDPTRKVASLMSSTSLSVMLPPKQETSMDISCVVQRDLHFLQISNHMHDYGKTTETDYTDPMGVQHMLKEDPVWSGDWALNPNFTIFPADAPGLIPKGSTLHTRCTWTNSTTSPVKFPTEMCVFFGIVLNESDLYCTDGKWSEPSSPSMLPAAGSMAMPSAGASAQPVAGSMAMPTAGTAAPAAMGCTGDADQAKMKSSEFDGQSTSCSIGCALDPDVATCTQPCFENTIGLSKACAMCNAVNVACGSKNCRSQCIADSAGAPCRDCVMEKCDPAFRMCTGT